MGVIEQLEKFAGRFPEPAIRHSIMQTVHVLRYPMKEILLKVPGETLKDRAERIGVSRQTMYVWMHERFRPSAEQAAIISDLSGVPVWQIRDLQVDDGEDVGTTSPKARKRLAKDGKGVSSSKRRASLAQVGKPRTEPGVGRRPRKVR